MQVLPESEAGISKLNIEDVLGEIVPLKLIPCASSGWSLLTGIIRWGYSYVPERLAGHPEALADAEGRADVLVIRVLGAALPTDTDADLSQPPGHEVMTTVLVDITVFVEPPSVTAAGEVATLVYMLVALVDVVFP